MDVIVVFLMYTDKLVCINSGGNQEAIKDKLGGFYEENSAIAGYCDKYAVLTEPIK